MSRPDLLPSRPRATWSPRSGLGSAAVVLEPDGLSSQPRALLVRFTCFALFFFPSSMVIKPIGASGTVPLILAMLLLMVWLVSAVWGLHDPFRRASPLRMATAVFVLGVLAAYIALQGGWTPQQSVAGYAAADRWVLFAFATLGVMLAVSDSVRTLADAMQLARWILAGAFFSCLVGVVQFIWHINPMEWIENAMPGFTYNGGDTPFQQRGALVRVAGSTFHSIEFAVTSAMLLPLSIWRGLFDPRGARWFHWVQTGLLGFAIATTVSRSGILAIAVSMAVLIPFLPSRARKWVLVVIPFAVLALFLFVPGFVGTLTGALTANTSDPSIATRVNNYPRVAVMIDQNPLFGLGPGGYLPTNALDILDNEYLNAAVSMGIIGAACVAVYLIAPGLAALYAATKAVDPMLRCLAAALAGGLLVAVVCSATFDSLSFPVFALLFPILVGFGGAVWHLVLQERRTSTFTSRPADRRV